MDLHISSPCPESWEAMTDAGAGRHCAVCDKVVVDTCGLGVNAAAAVLAQARARVAAGGHICLRARRSAKGKVLLPAARRRVLTNGLALILVGGLSLAPAFIGAAQTQAAEMGAICLPQIAAADPVSKTEVTAYGSLLIATRDGKEVWRHTVTEARPQEGADVTALALRPEAEGQPAAFRASYGKDRELLLDPRTGAVIVTQDG